MQGDVLHTPLTRAGFAQADEMGALLRVAARAEAEARPLGLAGRPGAADPGGDRRASRARLARGQDRRRLREIDIGDWSERPYADVIAEAGPVIDPGHRPVHPPPARRRIL